jgi:hypothetical protein
MSQLFRELARRNYARYLEKELEKDFEAAWAIFEKEEAMDMQRQLENIGPAEARMECSDSVKAPLEDLGSAEAQMECSDSVKDDNVFGESGGHNSFHQSIDKNSSLLEAKLLYFVASVKLKRAGRSRGKLGKVGSRAWGPNGSGKVIRIISGTSSLLHGVHRWH